MSLHSNLVLFKSNPVHFRKISPFSLHSNLVLFKLHWQGVQRRKRMNFTFQSGSIQIAQGVKAGRGFTALHSNLVLFKFGKSRYNRLSLHSLHSNLVLFKCETFTDKIYKCHLYIPIWFYSNRLWRG